MFNRIRNAFEPMYNPQSQISNSKYVGSLPAEFVILTDEDPPSILYRGGTFKRKTYEIEIRDEGPGAWGYGDVLRKGTYIRRTDERTGQWYLVTKDTTYSVDFGGTVIETVEVKDDGSVAWERLEFKSI